MTWELRIAAIQLCSTADLAANLSTCRALSERAASEGARVVVLPECFPFLGQGERDKLAIAEDLDRGGPIVGMLRELSTKRGIWMIGGGMPEVVPGDPDRTYNTAVVIDPAGAIAARYRKIHLFDIDIPGSVLKESAATCAGDRRVTVDIDGAKVGLSICYDVRFPELYRALVKTDGAEILLVPAAFTAHTGAAHWHLLLRARAVEDQAYVIAAAQWGKHNAKRESYGHTLAIDPWGTVIGEQAEGDGVVMATLDGAVVERRRTQMPCLAHAVLWR